MSSKFYFSTAVVFSLLAVGLAFIFVPAEHELAYLHYKDKKYHDSQDMYQLLWQIGAHDSHILLPLVELYIQEGDVENAIDTMEQFVSEHPTSIPAIRLLGQLYTHNQMSSHYLKTLEQLKDLDLSEALLRELLFYYQDDQNIIQEIATLETLMEKFPPSASDYLTLAKLYAALEDYDSANSVLIAFFKNNDSMVSIDSLNFFIALALQGHHTDAAYQFAQSQIANQPTRALVVAQQFYNAKQAQHARTFVDKYLPPQETQIIAHHALSLGMKSEAEQLFFQLAQKDPNNHKVIDELLYIWGPASPDYGVTWVKTQAAHSEGKQAAVWLMRLINIGQTDYAIQLMADAPIKDMHPTVRDAYAKALLRNKSYATLNEVLQVSLAQENDIAHLKQLATIAKHANLAPSEQAILAKISAKAPKNSVALKRLATLAYEQADYANALQYIQQLEALEPADYLSNFYQGMIALSHERNRRKARRHFRQALYQIQSHPNPGFNMRLTEAKILYQSGKFRASTRRFEQLLDEYPNNTELKAQYAEILISLGRTTQARAVLG